MARRIPVCAWIVALLSAVTLAGPSLSQQEETGPVIYKWVDTNGIAHYTTDPDAVPAELRGPLDALRRERRAEAREPAPVESDDPWAELSVEEPGDLWVVQDSLGPADEVDATFDEAAAVDVAERERREAELRALDQQIASLQAQISADESLLKTWIANPDVDPVAAADDPEFRAVALRLPRLHGDLARLEQKRRSMGGPPVDAAP